MVRVASVVERNTTVDAPNVIVVAAATATLIFPPCLTRTEYVARYIQNVGANRAYYSFGTYGATVNDPVCDNVAAFHGYLDAGQQLDCSAHASVVCVYSVAGTTISTTSIRRNSMVARN